MDPFRFLHYREHLPGQALDAIELAIDGSVRVMEVRYLGQVHRTTGAVEAVWQRELVALLRTAELWPMERDGLGCISFGDGSMTHEAVFRSIPPDPAFERFVAAVRLDALQLAYLGELKRYATDEPSLAAGTIDQLMRDLRRGAVHPDASILTMLNHVALDRTVRPLVRDTATAALALLGRVPTPEARPEPKEAPPPKPVKPKPPVAPAETEAMSD